VVPHRFQKGNCGSNLGLKSNPCFTKPWDNTNFESTTWCQTPRCEAIPSKQTRIVCIIKGNHPVQNSLSCVWQTQQHPKGKQQKKLDQVLLHVCCAITVQKKMTRCFDDFWWLAWIGFAFTKLTFMTFWANHSRPHSAEVYIDFSFWRFPQCFRCLGKGITYLRPFRWTPKPFFERMFQTYLQSNTTWS
jgi:hypothetical protein